MNLASKTKYYNSELERFRIEFDILRKAFAEKTKEFDKYEEKLIKHLNLLNEIDFENDEYKRKN